MVLEHAVCPCSGAPSLEMPSLASSGNGIDKASLSFLVTAAEVAQAELDKRKRKEEEEKEVEQRRAENQAKARLLLEEWGKRRKRKKRRKKKAPRTSSPLSSHGVRIRRSSLSGARVCSLPCSLTTAAYAWLGLLVTMLSTQCSLRSSTCPRCSASWPVWTRTTSLRSWSFLSVACARLVLLVLRRFLCSLVGMDRKDSYAVRGFYW